MVKLTPVLLLTENLSRMPEPGAQMEPMYCPTPFANEKALSTERQALGGSISVSTVCKSVKIKIIM